MSEEINITIKKDEDLYLFNLLNEIGPEYRKGFVYDALDHYVTLCDPHAACFLGYEVPEVYKVKLQDKSVSTLRKKRNALIKLILQEVCLLDGYDMDFAMFRDPDGILYSMGEDSVLGPLCMYGQRLRVINELLKAKKEEK